MQRPAHPGVSLQNNISEKKTFFAFNAESIWEVPRGTGREQLRPTKNISNISPDPSSPSERSERVGLYVIIDYVKVTVLGDPEEEAGQGKVR